MRYIEIKAGPWSSDDELPWWARLLSRILPSGNPDLQCYYQRTVFWWVELADNGEPQQEIGFDATGEAIVLAPVGDNVGMMLDASDDWSGHDENSNDAAEKFQTVWQQLWPKFEALN
ncbi:MAG: hypothetical protein AAF382_06685 [Pseudomonadota bacterium]